MTYMDDKGVTHALGNLNEDTNLMTYRCMLRRHDYQGPWVFPWDGMQPGTVDCMACLSCLEDNT